MQIIYKIKTINDLGYSLVNRTGVALFARQEPISGRPLLLAEQPTTLIG